MKKLLRKHVEATLLIGMLVILILGFIAQLKLTQFDSNTTSDWLFGQVQQLLNENQIEADQTREEFRAQCLLKANTAAYLLQHSSADAQDPDAMRRIAELLQVDELHLFDTNGTIVAGSEPKYFGLSFYSGTQMGFFLPMLQDRSMELCQDVTPNTAEHRLMQYAAVWREDGTGIVQIGVEPARLIRAMEKTEISYVLSMLMENNYSVLAAADPDTYQILGSSDPDLAGRSLLELGFSIRQLQSQGSSFHQRVGGRLSYCRFAEINGLLVGHFCDIEDLYAATYRTLVILALSLFLVAAVMLFSISRSTDKYILQGLFDINRKLQRITDGSPPEKIEVHTSPELTQLSENINRMVNTILESSAKLSFVMNSVQTPVGIYEYSRRENRVNFTHKLPEILALDQDDPALKDYRQFEVKLDELRANPVSDSVFRLPGGSDRYVKMDTYTSEDNFFGILIDVTEDVTERHKIERERDEDLLTGLYNRRFFYAKLEALFLRPDQLGQAALIMIDTDDLKRVNDQFGHHIGDLYLRDMADVLRACTAPHQLAARLSGDEFALLIYGCQSERQLQDYVLELAEKQSGYQAEDSSSPVPVQFSMGVVGSRKDGADFASLLKQADLRMYENKHNRKQPT